MTHQHNLSNPSAAGSMVKPMLTGAAIALTIIVFFLVNAGKGNPAWGQLWMVRPLVIVPLAGAAGGAFYYFMLKQNFTGGRKMLAILISLIAFIICIWLGSVLGLKGTYWN